MSTYNGTGGYFILRIHDGTTIPGDIDCWAITKGYGPIDVSGGGLDWAKYSNYDNCWSASLRGFINEADCAPNDIEDLVDTGVAIEIYASISGPIYYNGLGYITNSAADDVNDARLSVYIDICGVGSPAIVEKPDLTNVSE